MNTSKKYKCPYCDYRDYRDKLINHVEEKHDDMIPKNYTAARVVYNSINKRDHGVCIICKKETKWDEDKQRYNSLCGNKICKDKYVKIVRSRMIKKYGKENLLNDPKFQKKMLEGRSISGKYKFEDGGSVGYVGSYEKKFLEFMDKFLHIKSYDIISPGPTIPYTYKDQEHMWITDFLYEPYNLVFDIKDGGDNPNTRDMQEYREKQIAKETAITRYAEYNYIRLTDNKFEQLIQIFLELKEKDDDTLIFRINESSIENEPSIVYFTKEITPKSLQKIYHAMNHELNGNIAVKISTGEPGGHNFLSPKLIKDLVQELNATIVECNTTYSGKRTTSSSHWEVIKQHGFLDIANVDIMDEESDFTIPIVDGYHLKENYVGSHLKRYNSVLMLSHFKGHTMAGYGGALKNMSIGMASSRGKLNIHTAGEGGDMMKADRNKFLESMVDADQSIINYFGDDNILYINVANKLSIDCDCFAHPKDPEISDIGIFASTDPVAVDQACVDAIYNHPDPKKRNLINRIETRNGTHTIDCAFKHNLGNKDYIIIDIDR